MEDNEYRCEKCGNIYEKWWSDDEADNEALKLHGKTHNSAEMAIICDDCFNEMRNNGLF